MAFLSSFEGRPIENETLAHDQWPQRGTGQIPSCKIKLKAHFAHSSFSCDGVMQPTGYFSIFPLKIFFLYSLIFNGDKGRLKVNETAVPCTSQNANNHLNTKTI